MQADGFLNQKRRHPVAMTAAVAINLAAVTALLLAKSGYVPQVPTILIGKNIPLPTEPEPNPPKSQPDTKARTKVYVPPVKQPARPESDPGVQGTGVLPPSGNTDTGTGEGTVTPPKPDPIPIPVITDPVPLASAARDFQPPYPPQLLRTGIEGKAVVRVLVGTDGRVKQVAIISADDPLFGDATERQALRKWRFKPATRDGVAIEAWKQLTVRFQITA